MNKNSKGNQEQKKLSLTTVAKEIDRENFTMRFVMSTPEVDRHGEVIDQRGWDFGPFLKNPVVLWGHDQSIPAVGKVVSIETVNGNTEGVVKFAVKENPQAKILFDLYAEGFMAAVSVGFMNLKWMYDEMLDVVTLLENQLFELSLVNVPANASALSKAIEKGIDVSKLGINVENGTTTIEDKFKNLGVRVEKKEIEDEEDESSDGEDEEVEDLGANTTDDEEESDEESSEEEVKAALKTLFKSDKAVIKASVKELENHLNDALVAKSNSTTEKRYSNKHINRLIASLLASKKNPSKTL